MSKKRKNIKEGDEQKTRAIDGLNDDLKRYLVRLGWNNPNVRNDFISVINSYILSGENSSVQQMITTYLNKGLDVLNIELNKKDIVDKQSVTRVDSDDIEDDEGNINENIKKALKRNKIKKQRKVQTVRNLSEIRKGLIDAGLNLIDSGKVIQEGLYAKNQRNYFSNLSILIRENEEASDQEKQVYLNNFQTFLKLYLENEYNWATDSFKSLVGAVISLVDKGAGSKKTQTEIDLKVDDLVKLISNNIGSFSGTPEETKNFEVASSELRKYAVIAKNWNQREFSTFFNNVMKLAVNSKNVNVQRKISQKLSEIDGSISSTPKQEEKPKDNKPKSNKEEQPKESKSEQPSKDKEE